MITKEGRAKDGDSTNKEGIQGWQNNQGYWQDQDGQSNRNGYNWNGYNWNTYNQNSGNWQGGDMKCFYYQKEGHQRNDYPLWKQHLEHENKNSQPKVGVNVAIVE